jgi:glutamine cyclotransferase
MNDGSDAMRFLDTVSFQERGRLSVKDETTSVRNLNELEYVRGEIFANVWHTDRIARISPESGRVVGWIDLTGHLSPVSQLDDPEAVLNGIAYDAERDRLFVTGKLWPRLFEIELVPRSRSADRPTKRSSRKAARKGIGIGHSQLAWLAAKR